VIVCIECTAKVKDELDELLRIGSYRDYSEAVALAVSNQLLLHRSTKPQGGRTGVAQAEMLNPMVERATPSMHAASLAAGVGWSQADRALVPPLFQLVGGGVRPNNIAAMPNDAFAKGQRITIDRWIFGQHNKLLPVKASIRALANLSHQLGGSVPLSQAATEIGIACESLAIHLRAVDDELGLTREDSLATAFPSAVTDINKSRLRFSNQFVGALNKHGQLRGFPIDLKLVNFRNSKEPRLLLTEPGWALASLANPILDSTPDSASISQKLSTDERTFLLKHIRDSVAVEDFAFRAVLRALEAGARNPDDLDDALREYVPQRTGEPFSSAFLSTQRAGAISRMTDLGLVVREREGLRVTYIPSDMGMQYLEN
jgi:hypothetical protein